MTDALVELCVETKYGVSVYSASIIEHPDFYIKTLKTSGIGLELNFQPHITIANDEDSDVENDTEDTPKSRTIKSGKIDWENIHISDVIPLFKVDHSFERVHHFKQCYGKEFNSCEHIKLFEIIETEYNKKYGTFVNQGPVYRKYNELCRKITMTEKQLDDIFKRLDTNFRQQVIDSQVRNRIDESKILIEQDPIANDSQIVSKLEEVMDTYRDFYCKQKEKLKTLEEEKIKQKDIELKKDLTIEKNQFGQYIYKKFNLVYDPSIKSIVGTANGMGGTYLLDAERVKLCQQLKIKYFVPVNNV